MLLFVLSKHLLKGYLGYFGYPKCSTTEGNHLNGRMCLSEIDATLRNDESFWGRRQPENHLVYSF